MLAAPSPGAGNGRFRSILAIGVFLVSGVALAAPPPCEWVQSPEGVRVCRPAGWRCLSPDWQAADEASREAERRRAQIALDACEERGTVLVRAAEERAVLHLAACEQRHADCLATLARDERPWSGWPWVALGAGLVVGGVVGGLVGHYLD